MARIRRVAAANDQAEVRGQRTLDAAPPTLDELDRLDLAGPAIVSSAVLVDDRRAFDAGRAGVGLVRRFELRPDWWDAERYNGVHAHVARRDGTPLGEQEPTTVARTVFRRMPASWDSGQELT